MRYSDYFDDGPSLADEIAADEAAEDRAMRRYNRHFLAHPDCRDPDHPGCQDCEPGEFGAQPEDDVDDYEEGC